MPSTLRRSRRRELTLTRSSTNAIRDKVYPEHRPCIDHGRSRLTDRTNVRPYVPLVTTPQGVSPSVLDSRPSITSSVYRNSRSNSIMPIHPIRRLPPELLVHVFMLGSFDDVMFPVLVSHVCHSWRAVALHAHTLWRRITLTRHSDLTMWQERLLRARSCALDIAIASSRVGSTVPLDIDTVALQMHMLIPYLARTRSLDISFDGLHTPYLWNTALGPLCPRSSSIWDPESPPVSATNSRGVVISAARLESLSLRYPGNDDTKEFTLFGGFAPRLTRLTVQGVRLTWLSGLFGNLRYLDYTHHGFTSGKKAVDELLSMLQVSGQLRELKLSFTTRVTMEREVLHIGGGSPIGDGDVVTLPHLESLTLGIEGQSSEVPPELVSVASRLSLPRLKKLYLYDPDHAGYIPRYPSRSIVPYFDVFSGQVCWMPLTDVVVEGRWVDVPLTFGFGRLPYFCEDHRNV
ncbi:hypothetical protein EDD16DRAFT_1570928 [Pisolithus croceorrhizus]|nr:hypothetical protein EDD16DRAFT_1570928 [Pisolithus croceorrhizus]KAI6128849.1 hypothetical protein EV401DRAFT_1930689 [Pisolithus croceorrhizus]